MFPIDQVHTSEKYGTIVMFQLATSHGSFHIAKAMTSNGKKFTVTREILNAVARARWNLSAVFKFCFCSVLLYNKSPNDWSLGEQSLSVKYCNFCIHIIQKRC